ncbi:hypothetical protein [Listeria ilorinensis]|uniref:hypothetical protein n=1 Tax=Listeria ilorinensis TaxID=2867439 RepID=UPI001EF6E329|nr:hypothetical protein [Listeria ilorinensis]
MSEVDIRYFVLPMIIVFILGIAAINAVSFPIVNFLTVTAIAFLSGLVIGATYQLVKIVQRFFMTVKHKKTSKKEVGAQYHKA